MQTMQECKCSEKRPAETNTQNGIVLGKSIFPSFLSGYCSAFVSAKTLTEGVFLVGIVPLGNESHSIQFYLCVFGMGLSWTLKQPGTPVENK